MASSTQPYGKMLDYEQYIEHQISRTRARIRMTDVLTAFLTLAAAALGLLFLEVVLDHTVGLPAWLRRLILLGALAGGGAFAILRVFLPMVRRVNGFYAARAIEETDPAFKNSLINYLDLRRHRDSMSKSALAAIEAKAVHDLTNVEIDSVVNQRRLMQMAYLLSGVFVVFSLYALDDAQEHPRLDQARLPGRRGASHRHAADQHQARPRPRALAGGRRLAGPLLGGHPGDPPPEGLPPLQRRRGLVLRRQGAGPGPELLRPLADDLAQRPAGRRLLPDRGRRRVAPLSPGGPARADGHGRGARIRLPGLYGPGPPGGHRGGARRGDRGDAGHRARPDESARAIGEPQVHQDRPGPDGGRDVRPDRAGRQVQGRRLGVVQDRVHEHGRAGQSRARRLLHRGVARPGADGEVPPARSAGDQGAEQRQGPPGGGRVRRSRRQGRHPPRPPGDGGPPLGQPAREEAPGARLQGERDPGPGRR